MVGFTSETLALLVTAAWANFRVRSVRESGSMKQYKLKPGLLQAELVIAQPYRLLA